MSESFFASPQLVEQDGAPACGLQLKRVEPQGVLKTQHSVRRALQLVQDDTKIRPKHSIIGRELNGLAQGLQSLLASAQALKRSPEARKVFRQRILPDCACDPLDGKIAVPGLKRQQSHQVKRVSTVRIYRERLLAIDQRIEISPRPQVMKACFIQRGRAACVDALRSRPGFCGRRAAFAAVHLRTPKVVKRPWLADSSHAAKVVLLMDNSPHEHLGGADVTGHTHLDRGLPVPPKGIVMEDGKRKPARQFRSTE